MAALDAITFLTHIPLHPSPQPHHLSSSIWSPHWSQSCLLRKQTVAYHFLLIPAIRAICFLVLDPPPSVSLDHSPLPSPDTLELLFLWLLFILSLSSRRSLYLLFLFPGQIFLHILGLINPSHRSQLKHYLLRARFPNFY